MTDNLSFPPLFHGEALSGRADPFVKACSRALMGCDSGLVVYNLSADHLAAAIVFAPELPLDEAMPILIACEIGFQNALGALAPPEVAVHFSWPGDIKINGAGCGRMRVAASEGKLGDDLEWIVVGLEIPLLPPNETAPGAQANLTCLYEEGCAEVDPQRLLEAWTRHTLVWINRWSSEGLRPLNAEWRGLVDKIGDNVDYSINRETYSGLFMGVDEQFGMLLRQDDDTRLIKLSTVLEQGGTT